MDFYRRVRTVLMRVPAGRVITYGQVALLCGVPQNSRQVGYALREGRAGSVPAHRVVNSRGFLSGAASFALPGQQRMMLKKEGVKVEETEKGDRVDLRRYGWHWSAEEADTLYMFYRETGI